MRRPADEHAAPRALVAVVLCWPLLLLACSQHPATPPPGGGAGVDPGPGEGVLFIGNSLTAANDLPGMVSALAGAIGTEIPTTTVAMPGSNLEDHWRAGTAFAEIRRGGWRAVVFQQGPSTLPANREHLVHWSRTFSDAVRSAGSRPYLYMVWPPLDGDWQSGIDSYRLAAVAAEAGLFPVADGFRAAWRRDPDLHLLGPDGFHPSPAGTYLAAVTIVAQLERRSPVGIPARVPGHVSLDTARAILLQQAVEEVMEAQRQH